MPNPEGPHLLIAEIPEYPYVSSVATAADWLRICSFSNLSEFAKPAKFGQEQLCLKRSMVTGL